MSDEPDANEVSAAREFNKRTHEQMQREIAEAERNRYQAVLDRWVQSQRDEAEEYRRMMRELNPTGLKIW